MKFIALATTVSSVWGQTCTSSSVYVTGADDALDGGFPGFPQMDGCYTKSNFIEQVAEDGTVTPTNSLEHELFSQTVIPSPDGAPLLQYETESQGWSLSQYIPGDEGRYEHVGEFAFSPVDFRTHITGGNPVDALEWFLEDGTAVNIVVTCGCEASPTTEDSPDASPEDSPEASNTMDDSFGDLPDDSAEDSPEASAETETTQETSGASSFTTGKLVFISLFSSVLFSLY